MSQQPRFYRHTYNLTLAISTRGRSTMTLTPDDFYDAVGLALRRMSPREVKRLCRSPVKTEPCP